MMLNLFTVFDPSSSIVNLPLNWMSIGMILIFMPHVYWVLTSRFSMNWESILAGLNWEMKSILQPQTSSVSIIFVGLVVFILLNNSLGLLPYVFTASSHLVFTISMAFTLWISYYLWSWINWTTYSFAHLVPSGTPAVLMPFMVLIESISSLIRPMTLAVRLAANMIAGHLLITLVSNAVSMNFIFMSLFILTSQSLLIILEIAVAAIQAYVFGILSVLYFSE